MFNKVENFFMFLMMILIIFFFLIVIILIILMLCRWFIYDVYFRKDVFFRLFEVVEVLVVDSWVVVFVKMGM